MKFLSLALLALSGLGHAQMVARVDLTPTKPGLRATPTANPTPSVSLSCTPPSTGTTAQSFNFYRATVSGGPYTLAGSNSNCSYTDNTVALGTTYYYVATALDTSIGNTCPTGQTCESPYSNQVQAVVPAAPTVTAISPSSGTTTGGTVVTITGTGFASGASVTFGSNVAASTFVNSTTITATTPAGTAGAVAVTITNTNGLSGSLAGAFTYIVPAAPNPPTNLTVGTIIAGNVPLKWKESGAYTAFRVYRKPTNQSWFAQIATGVQSPAYTDHIGKGTYNYEVRAVDVIAGVAYLSNPSNTITVHVTN